MYEKSFRSLKIKIIEYHESFFISCVEHKNPTYSVFLGANTSEKARNALVLN